MKGCGAGWTGAATKGRTTGAAGATVCTGIAATGTAAACGGSERVKRASSSSMRWSLPRVICSRALPSVRMARMASRWPS